MYGGLIIGNTSNYGGGVYVRCGTMVMYDGEISNNVANNNVGGAVLAYSNSSTFIMEGGTINGNLAYHGGAIEASGDATVSIFGGVITNNKAQEKGGALTNQRTDGDNSPAVFNISGAPVFSGNTAGGKPVDVYLCNTALLNVTGKLTSTTPFIVSRSSGTGVFTSGWKDKMGEADPSKYFTSDDSDYIVAAIDGEAWICEELKGVTTEGYEGDYDGKAHGVTVSAPDGAAIKYGTAEGSYTLTDNPTYTDAGTYTVYYEVSKTDCVSVHGYEQVKITPINVTVTVTGHTLTVDYDGKAHSADGYDAAADSALYDVTKDFTYSGKAAASRTNAGTTNMGLAAEQFENTNRNFATVTFNVTDGYVKIDPISVTVTIIGHDILVDYDGNIHSVDGYDAAASSDLYDVTEDFTFTGRAEALRTNAGKTDMGLKAEQFENTNNNFASVTFNVTDGYIKIDPIDVTVTVTGYYFTTDYDGEAHTASGYDVEISDPLYSENDFTFSGTAAVERTNAGTTDMGLKSEQFENINSNFATVVFDVTDGYVRIDPIDVTVTITGHTDTADYDGKAHSAEGYDAVASSDLYDITKDFEFSGTAKAERSDAGTAIMGLNAAQFENTNSNFAKVTFDVTDGYLTIDPINITVTITGHTLTVDYDGKAHSADGYDATADSTLYDVTKNITYSGRAEAIRTDVGTAQMGLTADKFSNTNDNFAKVTFKVTDGSITIDPVDAEITAAPHAKDQLVYNGSDQTLVEPGTATGGTLCYALGSDERIAPSDSKYNQDVPAAKDAGNYYIWYKVVADSNHNDIAPACVKVTLAEEEWTTVSGRIYDENNNPVSNATVSLTIGGKTVDQIISGSNGSYYFTAPPGLYNIVVKYDGATVTDLIDIDESTTYDVGIFDANTDSLLNIVGTDSNIVVGGLNKEAEAVRASEGVSSDKNVTVSMTVTPIAGGDTYAAAAIEEYASDRNVLYYDFEVEETVDTITTRLDRTQTVLEIAIPCSFINKKELAVYRSDGSDVQTLTESDSKAAGTYRVDTSAGMVFIYTDQITTYALGYKPYYSVKSDLSLGSYTGVVSVTLTNDGDTIYELNDISMDNISFRGVPKGNYSMTITWTDGAENTITTPFEIK